MRAYRKVEDRYELKIDSGRLALLGVGAALVLLLVFLLGVLVGKGLWGGKRTVSLPLETTVTPRSAPEAAPTREEEEEARPKLTFYDDLKKPDPGPIEPPETTRTPPEPAQPQTRVSPAGPEVDRPATPPKTAKPEPPPERAAERAPAPEVRPKLPAPVFTVQVGSFRDRSSAEELARQVAAHDASAQVIPTPSGGRTWYRVQVGRFETRAAAEVHYRSRLKPKGVQGFVTTR